ncbi:hypothetical protein LOTGIDRAFT_239609 [Lottia gigantea]|uniref:Uncharacterized protein n=1 Tax=Lottia gigantea TaxID=225164 RepID=V3ZH59_LOTGI|nr:hypothetical protein LOTGIDRAFT_239609 [Lottia gigantea]ESO90578.1 hypothetical protein LOTGIDRAFT_239609 [Lottia gigantea]
MNGTGGGSEPDIYFRKWELIVLDTLSPAAIVGIEGAVDTSCRQPMLSLAPPKNDATYFMPEEGEITIEEKAVNVLPEGEVEKDSPSPEQFQEISKPKRKSLGECFPY